MQMKIACPHCGTEYDAEENEYGRFVKCASCGKGFVAGTLTAKAMRDTTRVKTGTVYERVKNIDWRSQQTRVKKVAGVAFETSRKCFEEARRKYVEWNLPRRIVGLSTMNNRISLAWIIGGCFIVLLICVFTMSGNKEDDYRQREVDSPESPEYIPLNEPYKPYAEAQAIIDETDQRNKALKKEREDYYKNLNSSPSNPSRASSMTSNHRSPASAKEAINGALENIKSRYRQNLSRLGLTESYFDETSGICDLMLLDVNTWTKYQIVYYRRTNQIERPRTLPKEIAESLIHDRMLIDGYTKMTGR